jgi:hypothetical protein
MESKLHKYLKKIAMIKLHYMGCTIIYPEVSGSYSTNGIIDVGGVMLKFNKTITFGIEVKISRADYFGAKQKHLAKREEIMKNEKDGFNYKYFLMPPDLIKKRELYGGWGLMFFDGKRIKKIAEAPFKEANNEITLYSLAACAHNFYHQKISNLMNEIYGWSTFGDIESVADIKNLKQEVFNFND